MKRGPTLARGIPLAIPVALHRGHVMVFVPSLINIGEFLITGNGWFVLVGVRFARKIRAAVRDIEAEFAEIITQLRLVPRTGPVSCELWLYSRYDTLRHFRIEDAGLVELDLLGIPFGRGAVTTMMPAAIAREGTGQSGAAVTGPVPSGAREKTSPILRWLAKRNAARSGEKSPETSGGDGLKKILDAGGPGTKPGRKAVNPPAAAGPAGPEKKTAAGKSNSGATKKRKRKTMEIVPDKSVPVADAAAGHEGIPAPAGGTPGATGDHLPGLSPTVPEDPREGGPV